MCRNASRRAGAFGGARVDNSRWPRILMITAGSSMAANALSLQTLSFYKKVKDYYRAIGAKELHQSRVLDFGCGWGRIIRYFAKDVPQDNLFGCDPSGEILQVCEELRVPGIFRLSDFRPRELPFAEKFDLVYSYSVFTHLSEKTHLECLESLHNSMAKDGVLIVTFRPRDFLGMRGGEIMNANQEEICQLYDSYNRGTYAFLPHPRNLFRGTLHTAMLVFP